MFTDFECPQQSHYQKLITTVCLDKNCKQISRLCCLLCQKEFHNDHLHQLIEVSCLNKFIQQECNEDYYCSLALKQLNLKLEQFIVLIDNFIKIIVEKIENIKHRIRDKIIKIQLSNFKYYYNQKCNDSQQGIRYWNQVLTDIIQYVQVDNYRIKLKTSNEGQLNQREEKQIKIIKQSEESLRSFIHQINPTQIKIVNQTQVMLIGKVMQIGKLFFKQDRTNPGITIISECIIKKINEDSHAMAFANEGFDPNKQSYQFPFNMKNLNSRFSEHFGVGSDEGVQNTIVFDFNSWLGSGQYMICNYGYTYHNTDKSLKRNEFQNWRQDLNQIRPCYQSARIQKIIRPSKHINITKKTVVKMPIADMTKTLYPCAYLFRIACKVELVEYQSCLNELLNQYAIQSTWGYNLLLHI